MLRNVLDTEDKVAATKSEVANMKALSSLLGGEKDREVEAALHAPTEPAGRTSEITTSLRESTE